MRITKMKRRKSALLGWKTRRKGWKCLKCGKKNQRGKDCPCGRHELCNAIRVSKGEN